MRAREFIKEDTTSSDCIATMSMPIGSTISRMTFPKTAKYTNILQPKGSARVSRNVKKATSY